MARLYASASPITPAPTMATSARAGSGAVEALCTSGLLPPSREGRQLRRDQRRAGGEGLDGGGGAAGGGGDGERDLAQALLALAGAGAEAGVALHLLEV